MMVARAWSAGAGAPGSIQVVARVTFVLVVAVILQTALVADLRAFDASADLMLLAATAAGLAGGATRGASIGFASGLLYDLLLTTPFGLSALTYCLVGYVVGTVQGSVLRTTRWIPIAVAFIGGALGVVLYVLLGQVVGQEFALGDSLHVVLVVAIANALLILPAVRVMQWATGGPGVGVALR
jgi:rod shape-determining protein MreD